MSSIQPKSRSSFSSKEAHQHKNNDLEQCHRTIASTQVNTPNYSSSSSSSLQWIFTRTELESASLAHHQTRYTMSRYIQLLCKSLALESEVMGTAVILAHRFYCRESFNDFDLHDVGITSVFLACKIEDHPKRLASIIKASQEILASTQSQIITIAISKGSHCSTSEHTGRLLEFEMLMLQVLCFDLTIDHPFRYIYRYVTDEPHPRLDRLLKRHKSSNSMGSNSEHRSSIIDKVFREVTEMAWGLVVESYRGIACLCYTPKVIALCSLLTSVHRSLSREEEGEDGGTIETAGDINDQQIKADEFPSPEKSITSLDELLATGNLPLRTATLKILEHEFLGRAKSGGLCENIEECKKDLQEIADLVLHQHTHEDGDAKQER